jgi:probable HAF family extracellular repeat protein
MKFQKLSSQIALAAFTLVPIPASLAVQDAEAQAEKAQHHHYKVIEIGTFGGPGSYFLFITGRVLNNHGVSTGWADTPTALNPPLCLNDCFVTHTFTWKDGIVVDLGALPGIEASFPNDINGRGVVAGISLNGGSDPVIGVPYFDAVVFKDGQVIDLGTFGGALSYANSINDRDQVVGFALNSTPSSVSLGGFCQNFPMPTEMRAFIWHRGVLQNMGTLGGTDSCALFVNERGQATGNSFTNSTVNPGTGLGVPTIHPFLWDGNQMLDLGALANGTVATTAGINDRGQIAGVSNLADNLTFHAFLWDNGRLNDFGTLGGDFVEAIGLNEDGEIVGRAQLPAVATLHAFLAKHGKMIDLGSQDDDPCSAAISINVNNQIVGFSDDCFGNNQRAFLWESGHMTDLNAFVPSNSTLTLTQATFINDRREIAAQGVLPNGDQRAVLLIPCDDDHPEIEGCDYSMVDATEVANNAAAPRSPLAIPLTTNSPERTINPSQNWFRQHYRMLGQRPALPH